MSDIGGQAKERGESRRPTWRTLWVHPPRLGAARVERLRFVRDMNIRSMLAGIPIGVVAIVLVGGWVVALMVAAWVLGMLDVLYLTWRVRQLEADAGAA